MKRFTYGKYSKIRSRNGLFKSTLCSFTLSCLNRCKNLSFSLESKSLKVYIY